MITRHDSFRFSADRAAQIWSWVGKNRSAPEDLATVVERHGAIYCLVLDGMGGLPLAREAADCALLEFELQVTAQAAAPGELIRMMNERVGADFGWNHVGATVACTRIAGRRIEAAWLGDVRIAHRCEKWLTLTTDHTALARQLGRNPTLHEAKRAPRLANRVLMSLGERPIGAERVSTLEVDDGGTQLCLYSDGAWGDQKVPRLWHDPVWGAGGWKTIARHRPEDDATTLLVTLGNPDE